MATESSFRSSVRSNGCSGRCGRCRGFLYLDNDISLDGGLFLKCLQCGREFTLLGEPISRAGTGTEVVASEGRRFYDKARARAESLLQTV